MTAKTAATKSLRELYSGIQADLDRVEIQLAELNRSSNPLIDEINAYLFVRGGKRIRPALLTLCARLHGNGGPDTVFWSALVEIIHTASLIHDDIIDNTDLRRGRETVHARWGANITVLLGDHLYIHAINQALRTRRWEIIETLAEASGAMIEGELLECAVNGDAGLGEDRYFEILSKKTASLFSAACRIGGMLGGADASAVERLAEFGRNIGLAFQVIDDLLDFTGQTADLGKPILTDLREGRITLPLIYTLRRLSEPGRADLLARIESRKRDPEAIPRVQAAVLASGAIPEASLKAKDLIARAKDILAAIPPSPAVLSLARLADFILERSV
jgi:octaprenyl-diphosphate synthase